MSSLLAFSFSLLSPQILFVDGSNAHYNENTGNIEVTCNATLLEGKNEVALQRSSNAMSWNDVVSKKVTAVKNAPVFTLTDRNPQKGRWYYRFKFLENQKASFSAVHSIIIKEPENEWRVYPSPATDFVTLKYQGIQALKGVLNLYIYNSYGTIISRKRFASNQRTLKIPVDNLAKGVYVIRIFVENEQVAYEQFLKN